MALEFHRDNHYVPCVYLRRFAGTDGRIVTYRTLVPHVEVPIWRDRSIKAVAYHSHLYTRIVAETETDEIERWLDREFEAPAEEPLEKQLLMRSLSLRTGDVLSGFLRLKTSVRLHDS